MTYGCLGHSNKWTQKLWWLNTEVVSLALITVLGGIEVSRAAVLGIVIQGRRLLFFWGSVTPWGLPPAASSHWKGQEHGGATGKLLGVRCGTDSHSTGKNLVSWPHLTARKTGKWTLVCAQIKGNAFWCSPSGLCHAEEHKHNCFCQMWVTILFKLCHSTSSSSPFTLTLTCARRDFTLDQSTKIAVKVSNDRSPCCENNGWCSVFNWLDS